MGRVTSAGKTDDLDHSAGAVLRDGPAGPPRAAGRRQLAYLGICLVLIGLNLRTVFSSFAAVLPEVTADAGLPAWAVMVLTTVPVLRPVELPAAGHLPALLAGTAACGAAISLCNVLLPGVVKRDFPHRIGLMGGLYTTAICASAALGAGFTFPVFRATGQWTAALWFWAVPAGVVLVLFLRPALRARPGGHPGRAAASTSGVPPWPG